jgi:hypothetical protein
MDKGSDTLLYEKYKDTKIEQGDQLRLIVMQVSIDCMQKKVIICNQSKSKE